MTISNKKAASKKLKHNSREISSLLLNVNNAITHADRMIICLKTKIRNFKEEEIEKCQNDKTEDSLSEIRNKHKKLYKKQQMELKRKCHKHRNEKHAKMNAANGDHEGKEVRESLQYFR